MQIPRDRSLYDVRRGLAQRPHPLAIYSFPEHISQIRYQDKWLQARDYRVRIATIDFAASAQCCISDWNYHVTDLHLCSSSNCYYSNTAIAGFPSAENPDIPTISAEQQARRFSIAVSRCFYRIVNHITVRPAKAFCLTLNKVSQRDKYPIKRNRVLF